MRIFLGSIKLDTGNGVEDLRRDVSGSRFLLLDGTPRSSGCVCSGTPLTDIGCAADSLGLGVKFLRSK